MTEQRSALIPFPDSSLLSLLSLLLIVAVCSIVMLRASGDQTGEAVSGISSAFRGAQGHEPGGHALWHDERVVAAGRSDGPEADVTDNDSWLAAPRFESRVDDQDEVPREVDDNADAFRNLLGELQRFSQGSATKTLHGSIALDVVFHEATTEEALAIQLVELVRTACSDPDNLDVEFELTLWSSSPTASAWIRATVDAERLRARVVSLAIVSGLAAPRITSCSRIWPEPSKPRPAVTVVVRLAG